MAPKIIFVLFVFLSALRCSPEKTIHENTRSSGQYQYFADCRNVKNDKIRVEVILPSIKNGSITYCFPKVVPGIYGELNFGKYIENLRAFDQAGNPVHTERIDTNCWKIEDAPNLSKIAYEVNDGWEEFSYDTERFYRSAESMFKEGEFFLINGQSLFGFCDDFPDAPVSIRIAKPDHLYVTTTLPKISGDAETVLLKAENYRELVDNPMFISLPDTTSFTVEGIDVHLSAYSTSNEKMAQQIALEIKPLLENQIAYMEGKIPISEYTFFVYHNLNDLEGHFVGDGLEHSHSTVILLNMPAEKSVICETVYGIASHEFFHTITPLAIHSKEIEDYDFSNPEMSRHLWFYEGMTEYFTLHMQVRQGLESIDEFLRICQGKIFSMKKFDNSIPLTRLSKDVLQRQDQYDNFYLKGALACLLLDIKLREWSNGTYGVQDLTRDLMAEYGENKPFEDEAFFTKITELTDPSFEVFFTKYIEGTEPLPIGEYFLKAGIAYNEQPLSLQLVENPTRQQLALREAWLNN